MNSDYRKLLTFFLESRNLNIDRQELASTFSNMTIGIRQNIISLLQDSNIIIESKEGLQLNVDLIDCCLIILKETSDDEKAFELCEYLVENEGTANTLAALKLATGKIQNIRQYEHKKLSSKLIETGKYLREPTQDYSYEITKNPNYELTEITKETNQSTIKSNKSLRKTNHSIRSLNKLLFRTNILALIVSALTGIFIALQFFKDSASNQQQINTQLEQITQKLDSLQQSAKGIDTSFRRAVKDSFYQRHR
jgi:hypothetical protein